MLKHSDIIEKLAIEQKLSLIASLNNLNNPVLAQSGIPCITYTDIASINAASGYTLPPVASVANSWNADLMRNMGGTLSYFANSANVNMAITPDIRMRDNPYQYGLSEEPLLSERYVEAFTSAMKKGGVLPCFSECGLNSLNVYYADKEPNMRSLNEYYLRPFSAAVKAAAVTLSCRNFGDKYADVNIRTINNCLRKTAPEGIVFCTDTDAVSQIKALVSGNLLMNGDLNAIRAAYEYYVKLKERVNRGESEIAELESAIAQYHAIDESRIDEAADRVIDFALACKGLRTSGSHVLQDNIAVAQKASEEAVVLLKNRDNILPLKKGAKVVAIGNVPTAYGGFAADAFAKAAAASGRLNVKGVCDGYAADSERSDELIEEAIRAAKGADYAVLFLGNDGALEKTMVSERRLTLPANRLALISGLNRTGIKIIAVTDGGLCIDTSFDEGVNALLVSPFDGVYCAKALVSVITGEVCPSGRLATTYYDYPDSTFATAYSNKNEDKVKVGTFIGYRYYDTADVKVRYPFGYGLSYTQFQYSDIKIEGNNVTLTVKNTGKRSGSEVVQIYLGKSDSLVLRPKKVLAAFAKVTIPAGKAQRVALTVDPSSVSLNTNLGFIPEDGEYELYAGSSVFDVQLTAKITIKGKKFKQTSETISQYILPQSNVLSEGYVLEDVKPVPQKGKATRNVGLILSIVPLAAIIALVVLRLTGVLAAMSKTLWWSLIIGFTALFIAGGITFIVGLARRSKIKRSAPVIEAKKPEEKRDGKQSLESLFEELFDNNIEKVEGSEDLDEDDDDYAASTKYVKCNTTWSAECERLEKYVSDRGIVIDRKNASKLLSALSSSRLVLISSKNAGLAKELIKLLSEFFGSEYFADEYVKYRRAEDMFAPGSAGGEKQAARAVTEAERHSDSIVLSVLNGVVPEDIGKFFMPLSRCVNSPNSVNEVLVQRDGHNEKPLTITPNLWFVFVLKEDANLIEIDPYITNIAAYIDVELSQCAVKTIDESSEGEALSYSQFNALAVSALDSYGLNEESGWKKIDKLIKFITDNSSVRIENRAWRRMERYSCSYLACISRDEVPDKEKAKVLEKDALDSTIASELLLTAVNASKRHGNGEQGIISLLDSIFNEEDIPECKKIIALTESVTSV